MDDNLIFQSVNLYNFDPLSLFREEASTQHFRLSEKWEATWLFKKLYLDN